MASAMVFPWVLPINFVQSTHEEISETPEGGAEWTPKENAYFEARKEKTEQEA